MVTKKSGELQDDTAARPNVVSVDESSSSASTGSWDMAESTADVPSDTISETSGVQGLATHLQAAKSEQEVALLKQEVLTLRAKNLEQTKIIADQGGVIQELTEKVSEQEELAAENAMKTTLLENQDDRIKELVKQVEEKASALGEETVTDKFYEAEEEIEALRKENTKAIEIINTVLLVKDMFAKKTLETDCDPVSIFNTMWNGVDSAEIPKLKQLANEFNSFALEHNSRLAVAFITNAENYVSQCALQSYDAQHILSKSVSIISSRPSMLLEDNQVLYWSAQSMKDFLLTNDNLDTDELTLFRILQKWTGSNEAERLEDGKQLAQHIVLEHMDPVDLSKVVRPSGLVSDSKLCDAYGNQAEDKSLIGKRRVQRGQQKCDSVPSKESVGHIWDASNSSVLSSTGRWKTGRILSHPLKGFYRFEWSISVEKAGDILFGVTCPSFDQEQQDVTKCGMFLPKCDLNKGSVVCFCLDRGLFDTSLRASISGDILKTITLPNETNELLVTASVQNGASVKFLGFRTFCKVDPSSLITTY